MTPFTLPEDEENCDYRHCLMDWQQQLLSDTVPILIAPRDVLYEQHAHMHFHSHPEIFIQISGCNAFTFPTSKFMLNAGSIAIIPSGVPHGEVFKLDKQKDFLSVVLMPSNKALSILSAHYNPHNNDRKSTSHYMQYAGVDSKHLNTLLASCEHFTHDDQRSAQHLMASIFSILMHKMDKPILDSTDLRISPLVRHCRHIIYERFYEAHCNVQSLAKELGCTPNYLSAKFKRECKQSLSQFLNTTRLNHASELLSSSELSVQQIAWSCGYNATSYFIARFQEAFGETPGAYKR